MNPRITDLEVYELQAEVERPFEWGDGRAYQRTSSILRVDTQDGEVGWGPGSMDTKTSSLKKILVGQNPFDIGVLWHKMQEARIPISAMGSVDIALWDLKGRILGQPVYQLLGGALRTHIPAYATGGYYPVEGDVLEWLNACLKRAINRGFRAYKMKVGGRSFSLDVQRLELARELLGNDRMLMADATIVYDVPTAKRMGHILEKLSATWFEDPLPGDDFEGYRELSQSLCVPITAHYGAVQFPYPVIEHIKRRTVYQVQPSIDSAGGFTGSQRLMHLAHFHNVVYMPSCWATDLHITATLHFLAALPDMSTRMGDQPPILEYDTSENPLREVVLKNSVRLQPDGKVEVPSGDGLGVEVDIKALERYRI